MDGLACLNGEIMPIDRATVPIWDRGFLFGDAVYEMLRVYGGRCWLEDEHMARLGRGLHELEFPEVSLAGLRSRMPRRSRPPKLERARFIFTSPEAWPQGSTRSPGQQLGPLN